MRRILVIKLGALGDFVQATGAFADIRLHEKNAHITLLTTPALSTFASKAPWFDAVTYDARKPLWDIPYVMDLRRRLQGFDRVYDLQTNSRTGWYFWLAGKPEWCGIAHGCKFYHSNPQRDNLHSLDRLADQIKTAGVKSTHLPDLRYAAESVDGVLAAHGLVARKYALLVPGCSPTMLYKRWPHYAELAKLLKSKGETVALVGSKAEQELLARIAAESGVINLCGQTNLGQMIDLFQKCKYVVGNDTGPIHIAAASGAKGVALFGAYPPASRCAPRGNIEVLDNPTLAAITPQQVVDKLGL